MQTHFQFRGNSRLDADFEPHLFCNIGLSFGGGSEKSSFTELTKQEKEALQKTKAKTTAENTQTGTQSTTGSKTGTSTTESAGTSLANALEESSQSGSVNESTQALDLETQELLQGLVANLGEGGLQELVASLNDRALNADSDLAGITDPIVANARANLEEGLGQDIQSFARSAGGTTQNTIVQQLGLQGATRVEREVADLAATLGLQTRQLATEEQSNAANLSGDLLTQLTGVLKGAQTTSAGESSSDAVRALEQLTAFESTDKASTSELSSALSETALNELSTTVSQSTMKELVDMLTNASGSGKTKGKSFGISI